MWTHTGLETPILGHAGARSQVQQRGPIRSCNPMARRSVWVSSCWTKPIEMPKKSVRYPQIRSRLSTTISTAHIHCRLSGYRLHPTPLQVFTNPTLRSAGKLRTASSNPHRANPPVINLNSFGTRRMWKKIDAATSFITNQPLHRSQSAAHRTKKVLMCSSETSIGNPYPR